MTYSSHERRGHIVGKSRGQRIKRNQPNDYQFDQGEAVFWVSLEEAKRAIADKYEFLASRYERQERKKEAA
jgi:hypothetical protein